MLCSTVYTRECLVLAQVWNLSLSVLPHRTRLVIGQTVSSLSHPGRGSVLCGHTSCEFIRAECNIEAGPYPCLSTGLPLVHPA